MSFTRLFLIVLVVVCVALALVLRRYRARVPPWLWAVHELSPVLITWTASTLGVWLFAYLAAQKPSQAFDELALASGAIPALVVALTPPLLRGRVAGVVLGSFGLLLLADIIYFRFFGGVLPLLAVGSAAHIWDVRDSITALVETRDAWLLPLFAIAIVMLAAWPIGSRVARPRRFVRVTSWILASVICVAGTGPVVKDVTEYIGQSRSWKVISVLSNLAYAGIVVAHARDVAMAWRERGLTEDMDEEQRAALEAYLAEHDAEARRLREQPSFGALRGSNVIVVQMEAMQDWLVNADVRGEPVMPFLRSVRDRGLYFPNVYDQTGGSPTSDCEYLVLNGLHPLARGAVSFRRSSNEFVALPGLLREQGYRALSAHAYHRGMWNRGVVHPKWGFEESYFRADMPEGEKLGWGIGDKPFLRWAAELAKEQEGPFFLFLITLTSHHPYKYVPKEDRSLDVKGVPAPLANYLRSARYVDEALRDMYAQMQEAGLARDTTLVLYGDHDAKLKYKRKIAKRAAKVLNVKEATLARIGKRDWAVDQVPLFILPPEGSSLAPAVVPTVGGQIDIGATLLHYLGVDAPASFLGLPLLAVREGWAGRYDGAAADDERLVRVRKGAQSCHAAPGNELDVPPSCEDLVARSEAQAEMSALITIQDLASEVRELFKADAASAPEDR